MEYISTRDIRQSKTSASEAIMNGLSSDGGLYVPCYFPVIDNFMGMSFEQIALCILRLYLTDFQDDELKASIYTAYGKNCPVRVNGSYLELFHGRTSAFKDVALQLFPYLLTAALRKNNNQQTAAILTATSGDTGSAVLANMAGVANTRVLVFYPSTGISNMQKLQMTTQEGDNVHVFGIKGNFDDAQTAVKEVFADKSFQSEFAGRYLFTSANSINLGRLLPQIAYYFYGYSELVCKGEIKEGDPVNYVVPTGNFGNILAGYYAYRMGLPVNKLICATNSNNVLNDFIKTGIYDRKRELNVTVSPSMDILISSNPERFIYDIGGTHTVIEAYKSLKSKGEFSIDIPMDIFDSDCATDLETIETIRNIYHSTRYVLDPHTAVGQCVYGKYQKRTGDETHTMILATASPYKFPETIGHAIGNVLNDPPCNLKSLYEKPVLHGQVIENIKETIRNVLI
ncbi:MAG: threonine synthase [Tannerella sp.]|nr:threonine synthase [Tannerella sp.]